MDESQKRVRGQTQKNTCGFVLIYMKFKNDRNIYCGRNPNSGCQELGEGLSGKGHMWTLLSDRNVLYLDLVDCYIGGMFVKIHADHLRLANFTVCKSYLHKVLVV